MAGRRPATTVKLMLVWGQKRRFDRGAVISALPQSTDIVRPPRHVSKVPTTGLEYPPGLDVP
jgi:hypothetical protein